MKINKQLSWVFYSFLIFGLVLITTTSVHAQTKQQWMVAVTPYKPFQNLDFFFLNSAHPLLYREADKQNTTSVFVAIITPEQKLAYEKAGYQPKIIDENAGAVNQYYVMSGIHHRTPHLANQLQAPEFKNHGLELAYQVTEYTTLLKVRKGTSFTQLKPVIPVLEHYNARRLQWNLVPPTGRTSLQVQKAFPFSPEPSAHISPSNETAPMIDPLWVMSLILLSLTSLFLFFCLRTRTK